MHDLNLDLLDNPPLYVGEGISVRQLEVTIYDERALQNEQVAELGGLRGRNDDLQRALSDEMGKLREISEHLHRAQNRGAFSSSLRDVFSKLPWFQGRIITRNSIEQLLRAQYELSARRLKEAAEFADRLEVARSNLFDEIERLNARIIVSARNEEVAAAYINSIEKLRAQLEVRRRMAGDSTAEAREVQAKIDQARRLLVEHSSLLRLYATAEERLDKLKENTHQLAETIAYLRSDINLYVTAASEKLDVVAGQIQAIGAAADAAVVMLELKHSLEAMTEAINHTTRFVSETQTYFRKNVDKMVDELELYDEQTIMVFDQNITFNEVVEDMRVSDAMSDNLARQIEALAEVEAK
ncbi:MAG: hypothetical protein H0U74_16455 [Bradymonadaceae bacterium]|nr:hypothetical protein [Lujinxingiaceae bacterium]